MRKEITITRTDAVDAVFPVAGGRTEAFRLPKLRGGAFLRAFAGPERTEAYTAHGGPQWPGDYVIRRERPEDPRLVRIVATPGSPLETAGSVYVTTRGNTWPETATVEIYAEEERENG